MTEYSRKMLLGDLLSTKGREKDFLLIDLFAVFLNLQK